MPGRPAAGGGHRWPGAAPPSTPEYGSQLVAKRQAAAADPLFRELPITPDVLQWHVDEISELPPGAVLLASSPVCEVQAFRVGRLAWGLQFHIETTPEIVALWARQDAELLQDYDLPAILERSTRAHPDIVEVWQPVVAAFVALAADPCGGRAGGGCGAAAAADGRRRAGDHDRRADHRPCRDPGGPGGRAAGLA